MPHSLVAAVIQHLYIVSIAVFFALVTAVPLGIWVAEKPRLASFFLYLDGLIMTIPSVALYGLLMPVLAIINQGIGPLPAVIALVLYSQLPMLRNTVVGLNSIDNNILDAARGMGMGGLPLFFKVRFPLAFPLIMAGIRSSVVMGIGVTAIAAFIGAGGLGTYIMIGITNSNRELIITGAIATTVLALIADALLGKIQQKLENSMGVR
jgi:osmoprotectant transport system permease protein